MIMELTNTELFKNNTSYKLNSSIIENTSALSVKADMKAKASDGSEWKDRVSENTYSANKELGKEMSFSYKTELKMDDVSKECFRLGGIIKDAIALEDNDDTRKELNNQLNKSFINNAEFVITVSNPNGMTFDEAYTRNDKKMYGFTAVSGNYVISPNADGKLEIPDGVLNGSLTYYEKSRELKSNGDLVITIGINEKAYYSILPGTLEYDLVFQMDNIKAAAPTSYSSSKTYKLVGTVTGSTPVYISDDKQIANISYNAVQDTTDSTEYDTSSEISAEVKITTSSSGSTSGGGGGTVIRPTATVAPTATPSATPSAEPTESAEPTAEPTLTPTYAPDEVIPAPEIFDSSDHYAYIIGYPDGSVRPENNVTREEVATIFYRLLTEESREKMLAKTNAMHDVDDDRWSNEAISTLTNGGYITGYDDNSFKPGNAITRAEFVTLAVKFYADVVAADAEFRDVSNHWAKKHIAQAVFYRLINGYDDGSFKPDAKITRAEVMKIVNTILNRHVSADSLLTEAVENNWNDNPSSAWYYTDVFEATMSHDFEREEGTVLETWTKLKENPTW